MADTEEPKQKESPPVAAEGKERAKASKDDHSGQEARRPGGNRGVSTPRGKKQLGERGWFVIHTYAGYEDQVADSLKQRIDSFGMKDFIFDVIVPKEKQIEIKEGKRRIVEKRIYPGYVLVDMIVTDDSWYVVRNTPNVTGFIGF